MINRYCKIIIDIGKSIYFPISAMIYRYLEIKINPRYRKWLSDICHPINSPRKQVKRFHVMTSSYHYMWTKGSHFHCSDVIMDAMVSQITGVSTVCSVVCLGANQKDQSSPVTGLCDRNPPVTGGFPSQRASNAEMFPFDDVIMYSHC